MVTSKKRVTITEEMRHKVRFALYYPIRGGGKHAMVAKDFTAFTPSWMSNLLTGESEGKKCNIERIEHIAARTGYDLDFFMDESQKVCIAEIVLICAKEFNKGLKSGNNLNEGKKS
jgi:hypothetical protein